MPPNDSRRHSVILSTADALPDPATEPQSLPTEVQLRINPRRIAAVLFGFALLLALAHLIFAMNYHCTIVDLPGRTLLYVLFYMTGEVTVPTWYGTSLLLSCAILFGIVARIVQRTGGPFLVHWYGVAIILLALSIDEAADIHGAVSYKLQNVFGFDGALSYPWVIPAAILTVIVALSYIPFVMHLPPMFRRHLLLAGGLYVGGALGMELLEAAYDSTFDAVAPYLFMVAIEEVLEMTGIIVLLTAAFIHLGTLTQRISFSLASQSADR